MSIWKENRGIRDLSLPLSLALSVSKEMIKTILFFTINKIKWLTLCHRLQCWYPAWVLVYVPAIPLLIQLPANEPVKAAADGPWV